MGPDATAVPGRLRDSRDIVAVLQGGRRRAGRLVVLHIRSAPEPGPAAVTESNPLEELGAGTERSEPRVAVVASRKVGGAVNRNRAKRLLREASRRVAWAPGTDAVIVARNGCASSTMPAVLDELEELADQLRVTRAAA